jgi:apolipoprotein D and lipocalin family protein
MLPLHRVPNHGLLALLFAAIPTLALAEAGPAKPRPLESVPNVDLTRYVGTWYEIASFPQWFQKGCTGTTATYTLRADGTIDVLNRCARKTLSGKVTLAKGRARVGSEKNPARLRVSFQWPFWADYWIIALGANYEYAVVGHPNRNYLWILSRTPTMAPAVYDGILQRLRAQEYDVSRLQRTLQPGAAE